VVSLEGADLRRGSAYEEVRAGARVEAIELRRRRRVQVGELVSLVFENRDTLRAAAEEAVRGERIEAPDEVAAEANRFSALLPGPEGLAASLYLDVADPSELAGLADEVGAIAASVQLEVAGHPVAAEPLHSRVAAPAAYLRFPLDPAAREAWLEGAPVRVTISHPRSGAAAVLSDEQRAALAADLRQGGSPGSDPP
jgi:hypothetical protein